MQPAFQATELTDAFERAVSAIPTAPEFEALEVVTHGAKRNRDGLALSVMIDKTGGVDIATVTRIVSHINLALEAFTDLYTLEVESAGLNRPLVRAADYDRFAGENVKVLSTVLINNTKTHRGKLTGLRDENVIVETPQGELPIPLVLVKAANIEYDIRADLQRAKREKKEST